MCGIHSFETSAEVACTFKMEMLFCERIKSDNGLRIIQDLDVSKNSGTPKWMVKIMENFIKMG